jgi:hypothetical protein
MRKNSSDRIKYRTALSVSNFKNINKDTSSVINKMQNITADDFARVGGFHMQGI